MSGIDESRSRAVIEFFGCFMTVSSEIKELSDLSDGVVMFEALSEISPDHFDPTTIGRNLGNNWALKTSNLRKLLRTIQEFYHDGLHKDADFESVAEQIPAIAQQADPEGIMALVELVAAAAVTCEDKGIFLPRIMDMDPESARELQLILQGILGRITEYDVEDDGEEDGDSFIFEEDGESSGIISSPQVLFASHGNFKGGGDDSEVVKERDELRHALQDARRELASTKSKAALQDEDNEDEKKKLRALVQDLRSRLTKVEEEHSKEEQGAMKTNRELKDCLIKIHDLEEKNASLADELDVANSKASQLAKAEATVTAYRKKLESMGAIDQDVTSLQVQTEGYLRKIMELENENKKVHSMQKKLDEAQSQVKKLEARCSEVEESLKSRENEIGKLKDEASTAEKAKKMYQNELHELRAQHEVSKDVSSPIAALSVTDGLSNLTEKAMRLEIENSDLKDQVRHLQTGRGAIASAGSHENMIASLDIQKQLEVKNAEIAKLLNEKEKLETYTKKTLQKFQEKYFVALQECKNKLKEKHDKIEAFELRSANEKIAQKREERLLSSAMFELGLAMMQNRLGKL